MRNVLQVVRPAARARASPAVGGYDMDCGRVECRKSSARLQDILFIMDVDVLPSGAACSICLESLWPESYTTERASVPPGTDHLPVRPRPCEDHIFHMGCIKEWLTANPICPLCRKPLIHVTGYQPQTEGSNMSVVSDPTPLPGNESCGTLVITFTVAGGAQSLHDPLPGECFAPFTFQTFLPDNSEGEEVARLLRVAWNRQLLFRIGWNPTTSRNDAVVINGIEMKARRRGGIAGNGYPDVSYMSRLKADLGELSVR